ncbi:hypothetical protein RvY_09164-2 [Ramazzottius varieornatus]|uniref:Uncharacterized protein n=1 Tax=Ramazzottius varieornatus TaxID=947166 RepID=A0A1D1V8F0_RAMVA|nr:hypothetical protein RvY_09164-2 [Ramazzottius varieornatus]
MSIDECYPETQGTAQHSDQNNPQKELLERYFAMAPVRQSCVALQDALSNWTAEDLIKEEAEYGAFNGFQLQEQLLNATVLSSHRQPDLSYRKKFLKMLMDQVEAKGWEVLEEIWCIYSELCRCETDGGEEGGYRTFILSDTINVSLIHHPLLISDGTTGLSTWDAAFHMVEWISQHPEIMNQKRVLELGCGSGLTGICLCKLIAPAQYVFSDCHSGVLRQLTNNLQINQLVGSSTVKVCELDWLTMMEQDFSQLFPDVILACDIAYDPDIIQAFFRVLCIFSRRCGSSLNIFVASKNRSARTSAFFHETAESCGWKAEPQKMDDAQYKVFPSFVYDSQDCIIFNLVRSR